MGSRFQKEETFMKCVICKSGEVKKTAVQAEIKVGYDHLLVTVQAEACTECGEPYYNKKKSIDDTERRLKKHPLAFFRSA
jgi:YgiT-type zinc finger domain-containing protein